MDFFELLAQGADDANKKDGKNSPAQDATPDTENVEQAAAVADSKNADREAAREAAREAKRREKDAAREAKQREKIQKRAEKEEAREQKRLEREAAAEPVSRADNADADIANTGVAETAGEAEGNEQHDDPRAALAALLAGSAAADALDADEEEENDKPAESVKSEPSKPEQAKPEQAKPVPVKSAPEKPAQDLPRTQPVAVPNDTDDASDPVKKYEWTAPMPTAAAAAVGAGAVGAGAAAAAGANGSGGSASGGSSSGNGSGGDDSGRKQRIIAWSVVAGILVLVGIGAVAIAIPAINNNAAPKPEPTKTTETAKPTPSPTKTSESPTPTPTPTETPDVEVGPTTPLDVAPWGVTFDLSTKFGSTQWQITGNTLTMSNTLINSFPESCAALRTGWGVTKAEPPARGGVVIGANAYNLAKPSGTCPAASELYTQILGLTQAMVNSGKALP